jgi:plastocyanin
MPPLAARKEQMSRRKSARLAISALAIVVAAAVAVPALAAAPRNVTVKSIGTVKMTPNRGITDSMHFNRDIVTIQTGGRVTLVDETKQPHSWSAVKRGQVPSTLRQVDNCFGKGPCDDLAVAHGAIDPNTGEEQEPTTPLVNVGKDGFNTAGDSVLIPPGRKTSVKVTAAPGSTLYMICAIHPWMQNKVKVVRRAG